MAEQFFADGRVENGLKFHEYVEILRKSSEKQIEDVSGDEEKHNLELSKLNYQRTARILRTYLPGEHISAMVKEISSFQIWMAITEPWCGDSAQNLPYIYKIAELNPSIRLRVILRDSNPEIMDRYLSETGARSIPKLVAFDESGNELFQWGARPKEAQELVVKLKNEGMEKEKFLEQLHIWYGRDRGRTLEKEFLVLLEKSLERLHSEFRETTLIH